VSVVVAIQGVDEPAVDPAALTSVLETEPSVVALDVLGERRVVAVHAHELDVVRRGDT
jgi:hypothetical protein